MAFPFDNSVSFLQAMSQNLSLDLALLSKELLSKCDAISDISLKLAYIKDMCINKSSSHHHWSLLAGRVRIYDIKQHTKPTFSQSQLLLEDMADPQYIEFVKNNASTLDTMVVESRDWLFDIFSVETLIKSYLFHVMKGADTKIVETPQYMYLRVATYMYFPDLENIKQTYTLLSLKKISHATPTLAKAGKKKSQLASCVLMTVEDDLDNIIERWGNIARIASGGAGLGICMDSIRHSERSDGSNTYGVVGWVKIVEDIIKTIDQGNRRSSAAIYLSDWHIDIYEFLELKKKIGLPAKRAQDLFYGLWVSDLFMSRVEENGQWVLFCPNKAHDLNTTTGMNFEVLYKNYERRAMNKDDGVYPFKILKARDLWNTILNSQITTGVPYICFKDAVNRKNNQSNLGIIRCSNLCVSGDTFVLTKSGQIKIIELVGNNVEVWNGSDWSVVKPVQTGKNKKLLHIEFSNGQHLDCTPEHHFYIKDGTKIKAKDLILGQILIKLTLPQGKIQTSTTLCTPEYTKGFYSGYLHSGIAKKLPEKYAKYPHPVILIGSNILLSKNLYLNIFAPITMTEYGNLVYLQGDFDNKVPLVSSFCSMRWLEGLYDSTGVLYRIKQGNISPEYIAITRANDSLFLSHVMLLLTTFGITSFIRDDELIVPDIKKLFNLGFRPEKLKLESFSYEPPYTLVSVTKISDGPTADTFCFTEENKHMAVFNGILTGQCTEIMEYTDKSNISSCNLASIVLQSCVQDGDNEIDGKTFNFETLGHLSECLVNNLNQVIDRTYYDPKVPAIQNTNLKTRPIGIGIQGLADTFALLDIPWDSAEAKQLNNDIFECIYYFSVKQSMELSKKHGPYEYFKGSPISKGLFQFDLWDLERTVKGMPEIERYYRYDWETLRTNVQKYGVRNSFLTTCMPTATTAQIIGSNESIEPFTELLYCRTVLAGQFTLLNKYLVDDLAKIGLWNTEVLQEITISQGSIKSLNPRNLTLEQENRLEFLKKKYKTAYELPQKVLLDMALDRGRFICQSQSLNCFMDDPTLNRLHSFLMYGWKKGIKTGLYYLRQKSVTSPNNVSVKVLKVESEKEECSKNNDCEKCGA